MIKPLWPLIERGSSATGEVVDEYYRRYNSGDFEYIRASMLTKGAKESSSLRGMQAALAKLGKHTGGVRRSFKLLDLKGKGWYYRFDAVYAKGQTVDSFMLVKDQSGLKLENLPNSDFPCERK